MKKNLFGILIFTAILVMGFAALGTVSMAAESTDSGETTSVTKNLNISYDKGELVVEEAKKYLGKPYRYGATGPNAFDCSGLLYVVFKDSGMNVPRCSYEYLKIGTSVSLKNAKAGDVICFSQNGSRVSHVGIYMGNGQFIHASTSSGVIITSVTNKYWAPKIKDVRRVL